MKESLSVSLADTYLAKVIEHQPGLFQGSGAAVVDSADAERIAKAIAAFRATLILEFQKQASASGS